MITCECSWPQIPVVSELSRQSVDGQSRPARTFSARSLDFEYLDDPRVNVSIIVHAMLGEIAMADELMVILGAEVTMLIFVATMTLRAKRMDVLSGRFFERGATGKPPPIWVQTCRGTQNAGRWVGNFTVPSFADGK